MLRAQEILAEGHWARGDEAGQVVLSFDDRFRRRIRIVVAEIGNVLLDLPHARVLRDGDALRLEDGRIVAIRAADEPLMEVRAPSPGLLMRLAWHIGNRHLPARLDLDRILLRYDHVIAAMLSGLGGIVTEIWAPFDPESGAYAGPTTEGHGDHHHHHHG
jgi:urease accessory protein